MWYGYLADLVVIAHVAYVGYVVLGQLAIIAAAPFRWAWARNPWFRFTHLAAIGVVAYEAVYDIRCPLTVWEEQLRALAGAPSAAAGETFLGRLFHDLLFWDLPPVAFTTMYIAVLVLVLQGLVMYPPRLWRLGPGRAEGVRPVMAA